MSDKPKPHSSRRLAGQPPDYDYTEDKELDYQKGATSLDRVQKQRPHSKSESTTPDPKPRHLSVPEEPTQYIDVTLSVLTDESHNTSSSTTTFESAEDSASDSTPIKIEPTSPTVTPTSSSVRSLSPSTGPSSPASTHTTPLVPSTTPIVTSVTTAVPYTTTHSVGKSTSTTPTMATSTVVIAPMLPTLAAYDGSTNVDDFLRRFIAIADSSSWNDTKKAQYFPLYLTSTTHHWYTTFVAAFKKASASTPPAEPTWKDLKDAFADAFKSRLTEEELTAKLLRRTMREDETVNEYFYDVLKMCNKIDKDMKEEKRVKFLLKGLPKDLAKDIYNQNVTKTSDVLTALRKWEEFKYLHGDRTTYWGDDRYKSSREIQNKPSLDEKLEQRVVKGMQHFQSTLDRLTNKLERINIHQITPPQYNRPPNRGNFRPKKYPNSYDHGGQPPRKPDRTTDGKFICWRCNKVGHTRANCKVKLTPNSGTNSPRNQGNFQARQ